MSKFKRQNWLPLHSWLNWKICSCVLSSLIPLCSDKKSAGLLGATVNVLLRSRQTEAIKESKRVHLILHKYLSSLSSDQTSHCGSALPR